MIKNSMGSNFRTFNFHILVCFNVGHKTLKTAESIANFRYTVTVNNYIDGKWNDQPN